MKPILTLLCALALSGCAIIKSKSWPENGRGGLGEWMPIRDEKVNELRMRLDTAKDVTPPTMRRLKSKRNSLLARVRREVIGELYIDADKDMETLETLIVSIERRTINRGRSKERARA